MRTSPSSSYRRKKTLNKTNKNSASFLPLYENNARYKSVSCKLYFTLASCGGHVWNQSEHFSRSLGEKNPKQIRTPFLHLYENNAAAPGTSPKANISQDSQGSSDDQKRINIPAMWRGLN